MSDFQNTQHSDGVPIYDVTGGHTRHDFKLTRVDCSSRQEVNTMYMRSDTFGRISYDPLVAYVNDGNDLFSPSDGMPVIPKNGKEEILSKMVF